MTLLNFIIVGLLVYVILKMHTMSIELTWLRRYMVRLLTDEVGAAQQLAKESATDIGLEEFDGEDIHQTMPAAPESLALPTDTLMCMGNPNFEGFESDDDDTRVIEVDGSVDSEEDRRSESENDNDEINDEKIEDSDKDQEDEEDEEEDVPP